MSKTNLYTNMDIRKLRNKLKQDLANVGKVIGENTTTYKSLVKDLNKLTDLFVF